MRETREPDLLREAFGGTQRIKSIFSKYTTTIKINMITVNYDLHRNKTRPKCGETAKRNQAEANQWSRGGGETQHSA